MVDKRFYKRTYDLTNCAAEPINYIRAIQSYGAVVITDLSLERVLATTDHEQFKGIRDIESLQSLFDSGAWGDIRSYVRSAAKDQLPSTDVRTKGDRYSLVLHYRQDFLIWEFEPSNPNGNIQIHLSKLNKAINRVSSQQSLKDVLETAIDEVSSLMDYDRIMFYKFDEKDNGTVISERKRKNTPSYLHLKFPASDIPDQSRQLFVKERVRMIADTGQTPHFLSVTNEQFREVAIDLTGVSCRGVSPIHVEYLQNIGVKASLSCAIVQDNRLWGLIIGHNQEAKFVTLHERNWLVLLSNVISSFITVFHNQENLKAKWTSNILRSNLITSLKSKGNFHEVLQGSPNLIVDLIPCDGVIIREKGAIFTYGKTPEKKSIHALISYLSKEPNFEIFHKNGTAKQIPSLSEYSDLAGIMAIELSKAKSEYIIWYRVSQEREVAWAGNPSKAKNFNINKNRLEPRGSFAVWKELTRGYSTEWSISQISIIDELRRDIDEYLYKKYDELSELYYQLENSYKLLESFSYSVSHDLKASVRNISGLASILRKDFESSLDADGIKLLDTILKSTNRMSQFIEDILKFSRAQNTAYRFEEIEIAEIIGQITAEQKLIARHALLIEENISGTVYGDRTALFQLLTNLISNAIKYSRDEELPKVKIESKDQGDFLELSVADNGIGFDPAQSAEIFKVFSRLVRDEEYEGTGIGLAIALRVVKNHKGSIRAESKKGDGAKFIFTLPKTKDGILS